MNALAGSSVARVSRATDHGSPVHAPHIVGYFRTEFTSFELVPRTNGRTEIIERTSHELKLEPIIYWLPLARWVVHANNARVLAYIHRQAEISRAIY